MKRLLLAGSALALSFSVAQAADYPASYAAAYDWSGFYAGAAVGHTKLWANDTVDGFDNKQSEGNFSAAGIAGYNIQAGSWVLGLEGDVRFGDVELNDGEYLLPLEQEIAGSIRGRVGYAFDNLLLFATGGIAFAKFEADHDGDGTLLAKESVTGFTVGGGAEYAFTDRLSARVEYLYTDYGDESLAFGGGDVHPVDIKTHDVRVGLFFHF